MKYETERINVSKLLEAAKAERIVLSNKHHGKVMEGSISGTKKLADKINSIEMLIDCLLKIGKSSDL